MGFIKERYSNNRAGLVVAFRGKESSAEYFAGTDTDAAIKHFNLYLKDNILYEYTPEEEALDAIDVSMEDAPAVRVLMDNLIASMDDTTALANTLLFPLWNGNSIAYEKNVRVRYNGLLYRCITAHTSQDTWTPIDAASLWTRIAEPAEWPEWIQPSSAQDAYALGAKVTHEDIHYISLVANNVWVPGAAGSETFWEAQTT